MSYIQSVLKFAALSNITFSRPGGGSLVIEIFRAREDCARPSLQNGRVWLLVKTSFQYVLLGHETCMLVMPMVMLVCHTGNPRLRFTSMISEWSCADMASKQIDFDPRCQRSTKHAQEEVGSIARRQELQTCCNLLSWPLSEVCHSSSFPLAALHCRWLRFTAMSNDIAAQVIQSPWWTPIESLWRRHLKVFGGRNKVAISYLGTTAGLGCFGGNLNLTTVIKLASEPEHHEHSFEMNESHRSGWMARSDIGRSGDVLSGQAYSC